MSERAVKNVLVSGASISGPALGHWLTHYGINTTIVEKSSYLRGGGYPIDIRGTARDVVERMGLYEALKAKHVDSQYASFIDASGGIIAKIKPEALSGGVRGQDIEIRRGDLAEALFEATKDKVTYRFNDSIAALKEVSDGVEVTFANGDTAKYDIVIGSDGLHSHTRNLVLGIHEEFERYMGQCFAGFSVPNTFGLDRESVACTLPARSVILNATKDSDRVHVFLCFRQEESPFAKYELMSDADKRNLTAEKYKGIESWIIPQLVEEMKKAEDLFFDSVSQIHLPAWSKGRVALAGDAAHATSFFSGQGSSMALVSAYMLAGELATKPDYRSAFAAYEALTRPFVELNQSLVKVGEKFLRPDTQEELDMRNEALREMANQEVNEEVNPVEAESREAHSALTLPDYV
ncbi:FAD-dependent monooxygenase [Sphingomonas sp. Root710]|uniref:FAD-dependent monooxygenase n=1 Tax=Sphingomonas sp. Root710 TaxID=1736594 RepID=UPI0009E90E15|nr:FAD-dependent monooxygenase [Sphingomonas sp. Root710]